MNVRQSSSVSIVSSKTNASESGVSNARESGFNQSEDGILLLTKYIRMKEPY